MASVITAVDAMRRAVALAACGRGCVEPNPPVGAILIKNGECVGEGFHPHFGGPHAEVVAIREAGEHARGATLFVTLEPCCHFGKTPPCTQAVIEAGVRRVVVSQIDPFAAVRGRGIRVLRDAGVHVDVGFLGAESAELIAPFRKHQQCGLPYVHAKWAMTLDGKIATKTGQSKWISGASSRSIGHSLRQRVDAIVVGANTARVDDPQLTARPPGPRPTLRVVLDRRGSLSTDSNLFRSLDEAPLLVVVGDDLDVSEAERLRHAGAEVMTATVCDGRIHLRPVLRLLAARGVTNVLVEGGADVHGSFFAGGLVDEVHTFVSPKVFGGEATTAVGGVGVSDVTASTLLVTVERRCVGDDLYVRALVTRAANAAFAVH